LEKLHLEAQYPDQKALDDERTRVGEVALQREYLLMVVAEKEVIIKPERNPLLRRAVPERRRSRATASTLPFRSSKTPTIQRT